MVLITNAEGHHARYQISKNFLWHFTGQGDKQIFGTALSILITVLQAFLCFHRTLGAPICVFII